MLTTISSYFGVTDIIDILATSIFIYYVLLLIRGTRAVQILTGVGVLVALLAIASIFHLYLMSAILQLLVVGAAVSLPIIFQPELRRGLEQLGRGGLWNMRDEPRESRRVQDPSITKLADAAFLLAGTRTGALIVIEQQSGLKDFIESGTFLDARLSIELLLAIFNPRSPLHDGAVIVRGPIVEAAGCFLPLAEPRPGERRIGTRHRAALGLSEQTDAVVVVVSEETGAISVARLGKLSRPIEDEQRLIRLLLAMTRGPRERRPNDFVTILRHRLFPQIRRERQHADHPQELRT